MKVITKCSCCDGTGKTTREIKVGDVLTPLDGSGMPTGLQGILFTKTRSPFRPIRVLDIQGKLLAVEPAHWNGKDIDRKWEDLHKNNEAALHASMWIWEDNDDIDVISQCGFWIDAQRCHLVSGEEEE